MIMMMNCRSMTFWWTIKYCLVVVLCDHVNHIYTQQSLLRQGTTILRQPDIIYT